MQPEEGSQFFCRHESSDGLDVENQTDGGVIADSYKSFQQLYFRHRALFGHDLGLGLNVFLQMHNLFDGGGNQLLSDFVRG